MQFSSIDSTTPQGTLWVVATPIGNLSDFSDRARQTLASADLIAAEDTRTTRLLFNHGIKKPRLVALHQHNEKTCTTQLITELTQGKRIALVTDAGTPGISDPGAFLVAAAHAAHIPVIPIPGPCAGITALSAAGFSQTAFHFNGFLPSKSTARRALIARWQFDPAIQVFFEAPHRIVACIDDLHTLLDAARELVIGRELTKQFETVHRLPLGDAPAWFAADRNRTRGEFVCVLDGAAQSQPEDTDEIQRVLVLLLDQLPVKQAVDLAVKITGAARNRLYADALAWKETHGQ